VPPLTKPAVSSLLAFIALTWTSSALAHELWIERGEGGFVLRYGHHGGAVLPLQADKVKTLLCRKDKGKAEDLRAKAVVAPKELGVKAACASISAFFDGGFYSLTPDGEKNLPKNQVANAVKAWRSKQFAKWVDSKSPLAGQPQGDEFEIVPASDLAKAKTGERATFRVLLSGKPLAGAVLAIDHKPLGETDDKGEARIKIRAAHVEQVSASFRRRVESAEADSEVFEASLTFEVAR
jgi:nickel transport protein